MDDRPRLKVVFIANKKAVFVTENLIFLMWSKMALFA